MTQTTTNQKLPTYAQMRKTDLVLLAIANRYDTLMHSYDLSAFSTIHHPALAAYEQRKISTYDADTQAALIKELTAVLDSIVARCVELVADGLMQPMEDKRTVWGKVKDFVKCTIFRLPPPVGVRVRRGVQEELAKRAASDWAE